MTQDVQSVSFFLGGRTIRFPTNITIFFLLLPVFVLEPHIQVSFKKNTKIPEMETQSDEDAKQSISMVYFMGVYLNLGRQGRR